MNIENCPDCGGTHFGSGACPFKYPPRQAKKWPPKKPTEAEAFIASIRTRVGQIKKAQRIPTADAWGQIEIACDKLLESASTFERACSVTSQDGAKT